MTSTTQEIHVPRLRRALARPRLRPRSTAVQLLAAFAALGVAVLVLGGHELSWLAGLVAGAAATAWFTLARAPQAPAPVASTVIAAPARVEPRADGEQATRDELARLGDAGWQSVHDIEARFGHYGHVAVGPGGVLLIDSLHLEHATGPEAERELTVTRRRALAATANLRDDLRAAFGRTPWVAPVIVVWSPFPAGCMQDGRCTVISGPRLADWLRRRPGQLGPEQAADVQAALLALAPAGVA